MSNYNNLNILTANNIILNTILSNKDLKSRLLSNIVHLDLANTYKGWRHYKMLPVRGQRTSTNSSTCGKINNLLKYFKLKIAKQVYGSFNDSLIVTASSAEQYNNLWYFQWHNEWLVAKKKRTGFTRRSDKVCVIDLLSTSKGEISVLQRPAKPGKKKRVYKDNTFTVGFNPGYTKTLISNLQFTDYSVPVRSKLGTLFQVLTSAPVEKKKNKKKVSSVKKKTDKIAAANKKKSALNQKSSELKRLKQQKVNNLKKK